MKRKIFSVLFALVLVVSFSLVMAVPAMADTINVPGDYTTIQAAIDAAQTGETVLVAPGTYFENINFKGKAITVKSTSGPGVTTIDGGNSGTVVTFNTGEGQGSAGECQSFVTKS